MGIAFDRILDGFEGQFHPVEDELSPPAGRILGQGAAGWIVSHEANNSFILTNRLLKAGLHPSWLKDAITIDGQALPPGAIWIPNIGEAHAILARAARSEERRVGNECVSACRHVW